MKIKEILTHKSPNPFKSLKNEITHFLEDSKGLPLFKSLPRSYSNIHKVKVRLKKQHNSISETFNLAFDDKLKNLHQRAIFANSVPSIPIAEDLENFYIFPINGYKFLYNSEIKNSTEEFKKSFNILQEQFDLPTTHGLISDLLQYTYSSDNLFEGISSESEIIFYNVPYYYAIKCSGNDNYPAILTLIAE